MRAVCFIIVILILQSQVQCKPTTKIKVTATAYCYVPKTSKWSAKDRIGTCAVDPRYIPYGSIVIFTTKERAYNLTAIGRHGKSGRVIDVFLSSKSECIKFGRKSITVEVSNGTKHKYASK